MKRKISFHLRFKLPL